MPVVGPPVPGPITVGNVRQYRARGVDNTDPANPLPGNWSSIATPSPGPTTQYHWFLSDPTDQTSGAQFDMQTDWKPNINEQDTLYYPIGRKFPVKSTLGVYGQGGIVEAATTTFAAWQAIVALLKGTQVLLLQGPFGQYYISLTGPRIADANLATIGRIDFNLIKQLFTYNQANKP
jgi:hypothetical protein